MNKHLKGISVTIAVNSGAGNPAERVTKDNLAIQRYLTDVSKGGRLDFRPSLANYKMEHKPQEQLLTKSKLESTK